MQRIAFYLIYPFIFIISRLPSKVLYFISSNLIFPILFYVIKYRRGVVTNNLKNAFPENSISENAVIEQKFYKYLSDMFIETIQSFNISKNQLLRIIKLENPDLLLPYFEQGRSVVVTMGHIGNYELIAKILPEYLLHKVLIPYHKMSNNYFNQLFYKSRTAFGSVFFPTFETFTMLKKEFEKPFVLFLANDQSAPPTKSYWTKFLNQDTTFFVGTEKIAKQLNLPVVYAHVTVPEKGHYTMTFEIITENPNQTTEGFIMEKHASLLENDIIKNPEYWLWTHKRWKHKMPEGFTYGFNTKKS